MKIIFFSSHTATWYFALAEATLASALQKKGHEVLYITPGNIFSKTSNIRQENILRKEFDLKGYTLGSVLNKNEFNQISSILKGLNQRNFSKLQIDDLYIGKIALYELLLNYKKMDVKFSAREWKKCLSEIKNTLISFYACKKIIQKDKPDRILMYNCLYAVNHVWKKYGDKKHIPVYFLHHGPNLSDIDNTLLIAKNTPFYLLEKLKKSWNKIKNIPVKKEMLSSVTAHFLELLRGRHYLAYSSPKDKGVVDVRKKFNISDKQKILTATISSNDEMFAAQFVEATRFPNKLLFNTQVEWLKILIKYVEKKPELFLILRVHPREFPNKREGVKSDHAKKLERLFTVLPKNVRVNWPTDNVSIYDLAQHTDVFLNAWSSVGVEMSLLGIPVVAYSKDLIFYPQDLNYVAESRKDYFAKIQQALKDGWSYSKIIKTYRWLVLNYYHTVIRIKKKSTRQIEENVLDRFVQKIREIILSSTPIIRAVSIKIYSLISKFGINKRQRKDCANQLKEKICINNLEKMLLNSDDSMVDVPNILTYTNNPKDEDMFIRKEIGKIYKAMYGKNGNNSRIDKNSLQYNLHQVINN